MQCQNIHLMSRKCFNMTSHKKVGCIKLNELENVVCGIVHMNVDFAASTRCRVCSEHK
jgi:hypothetical protein